MKKYLKKVLIVTLCLCTIIGGANIGESNAAPLEETFGTVYYQVKYNAYGKKYTKKLPKKSLTHYTIYEAKKSGNPGGVGKAIRNSSISAGAHYVVTRAYFEYKNGKRYLYYSYQKVRKVGGIYVIDKNVYNLRPWIRSDKLKKYIKTDDWVYVLGASSDGVFFSETMGRRQLLYDISYYGKVKSIKKRWTPGLIAG